ncbi:hydroxypyruvate isomerase [Granulicella aggregans]|uniref:Hydroxypyruvate isomerase n=1 Tax=Granulicella aggregans TaxID=474949 RepID=A0A7W7ZEU7_9BACT|nr:TIM barrel protein [Granulicella aggregans]MBB5058553.1 hydroxypyruvate isomerase [Granulicella aggregans]
MIQSSNPMTRRRLIQTAAATAATLPLNPLAAHAEKPRHNRIHQSVSRWCYQKIPLDTLCTAAAAMGLKGIDLLNLDEWEIPKRYGLICTMGYAGGGEINQALNRVENHAAIEAAFRKNIPLAAKAGVPNVITFSGLRAGLSDDEGARNTVAGLKRLKPIAEDNGVTINMELLNSKRDHHDYMCDHTAWGVRVCEEVGSPRIKLLYDIYHMQIMEGDLIATIRTNHQWLGHYHTGGVPGRHELDDTQEVQWAAVMRAIADTGFTGYVAHEFVPTRDPLTSLRQAVDLCDV